ncbi:hypothetical protein PPERSA_04103 [Pseudocohnilembus persalinus]|uniref:Spindle pole body component n=1 Tax=Pseudocohnilembus persalinus TaxID=266149 RepID=A0A0V0QKZ1_PSEPJ|nr:hypothetical protein PPERSA_04103 [Pseudocohnilembus persalinus]|eukprot:KRX02900.1 hypothetical protein PPERSA_04103 [Pseudocohnilembus persalinus]
MLHEILFALLGKPGNIIKEYEDKFQLEENLNFLNNSEKSIINQICILGFYFQKIEQFLEENYQSFQKLQVIEKLNIKNSNEAENEIFQETSVIGNSAYLKAFCFGVEGIIDDYREKIISIEKNFLKERVFTIASLRIKLSDDLEIIPDLYQLIEKINDNNIKGGQLLDLVFNKSQTGNSILRELYQKLSQENNWEYDWDQMYSIRLSQLPQSYISIKQAEKILFIGKGMRVLRSQKNLHEINNSFLPEQYVLQLIGQLNEFGTFQFNNIIEKLRYYIANQLLDLVIKKENLFDHLSIMLKYFLMTDGEFFQVFQEESRDLMQLPPNANAEQRLNNIILPQTILKLGFEDKQLIKNLFFRIKSNGFDYPNFQNLTGLNIMGNVVQSKNQYIRFNPMKTIKQSGSCWFGFRQNILNGFKMNFSFRFKKEKNFLAGAGQIGLGKGFSPQKSILRQNQELSAQKSVNSHQIQQSPIRPSYQNSGANYFSNNQNQLNQNKEETYQNIFCLCFQSQKEISSQKVAPVLLSELNEYLVNFIEEQLQVVKIEYKDDILSVFLDDYDQFKQDNQKKMDLENVSKAPVLKIKLKIQDYLKLDIGKCYVGFLNNSINGNCAFDLMGWNMLGYSLFNSEDSWNGLTLDYTVKWPLNLILSSQVMEQYKTLFRLFFPFRQIQVDIQKTWFSFMRYQRRDQLTKNYKDMLVLRNQMGLVLDSFWSYFHCDVIQGAWVNLCEKIKIIDDFEELRSILEKHLESIKDKVFLKKHNILEKNGIEIEFLMEDFENIKNDFENTFLNLLNTLILLNKESNENNLFQLLLKLDYNKYYEQMNDQSYLM